MAWIEPKTDWSSADYVNVADWSRIEANTEHLGTLFSVALESLALNRTITGFPYAAYINFLARNVLALPDGYYIPVGWALLKSDWASLDPFSFELLNDIEQNLFLLKQLYDLNANHKVYYGELICGEGLEII